MPTDTDIRLRSWLDGNQRDREQMCRALLALNPHYSDVRPRHPAGGRDGGRDIEALFDGGRIAYGAIGFQNGANDSGEQKKQIRKKFSSDLRSAISARSDLKAFAFATNLHFTMGEQLEMVEEARKTGISHCEILDRERLRIELDSPAGFFVRFQYLGIPLSEAEQASFLAHYGDRIQEVVSTGFQRIERTLNRILFLQEASNVLDGIYVRFELKQSYSAVDIGHFRAFVSIYLRAIKHDILEIWFGVTDKSNRFRSDLPESRKNEMAGIAHGIASGQWERHASLSENAGQNASTADTDSAEAPQDEDDQRDMVQVGSASSIGMDPVSVIIAHYSHDDFLIRYRPRLELRDLDDCMFMPALNRSLAEKLHSIQVFANGYKLAHIDADDFLVESWQFAVEMPGSFPVDELADPWVRIVPSEIASSFQLRFTSVTPKRMFGHNETPDRQQS